MPFERPPEIVVLQEVSRSKARDCKLHTDGHYTVFWRGLLASLCEQASLFKSGVPTASA